MRVLVTGADGFIGRQIAAGLAAAGHAVVSCGRGRCDFARDHSPEIWLPRLKEIDAVVNCAGILRERKRDTFDRVHVQAPRALFQACARADVRNVVQVSSLGDPANNEFIASKHRGDAELMKLDLDWVILRPSVVYTTRGAHGGTALLRAMAALPLVLFLPGDGQQQIAPICREDLARIVVRLLETNRGARQVIQIVGPYPVTMEQYLRSWRRWLGVGEPLVLRVPRWKVRIAAWFGQRFGSGPLGETMALMLERGNIGDPGAVEKLSTITGIQPRSMAEALAEQPGFSQDRWQARLYFLRPMLRIALAIVWIGSGIVGLTMPAAQGAAILADAGITQGASLFINGASTLNLLLGALLLVNWRVPLVSMLLFLSLLGYTLFIGIALPGSWLEAFGGILKNLALMPALLVLAATAERR